MKGIETLRNVTKPWVVYGGFRNDMVISEMFAGHTCPGTLSLCHDDVCDVGRSDTCTDVVHLNVQVSSDDALTMRVVDCVR
jgi:hypothetical protein